MKRLLALASFVLVLSFVLGADDETKFVEVARGKSMEMTARNIQVNVTECWVKTNEGKTYDFRPRNRAPSLIYSEEHYCQLYLSEVEINFGGLWTITTIAENGNSFEDKFLVTVTEKVIARPSNYFVVNAGQWVQVWIDGEEADIKACNLTNPEQKVHNLMKDNIEGIIRYKGCGIRMKIDKLGVEEWTLSQEIGNNVVQSATFKIDVLYDRGNVVEVQNYLWNLGKKQSQTIKSGVTFCQITRPDGTLMPMTFESCHLEVKAATLYHVGTWRASYGMPGKMDLEHIEINVKPWDLDSLDAKLIPGNGGEINLLCRTGVKELKFCSFIRPDQKVINAPIGVGNGNYSYYGDGYDGFSSSARIYGDCGLTIHKPSEADYGLWTCEMGIDTEVRAAIIKVVKSRVESTYRMENPQTFVKRGDRLKIQCKINSPLDYCWLTSPNGTMYSVLVNGGTGLSLKYDGRGLSMGECGAFIDVANTTDNGEWTCHLGITGSAEIEQKVLVQVTDSYLIPVQTEVYAKNKPTLTCRTFLGEEGTLKYCRWIRPNGHGITGADAPRYDTTAGINTCKLSILTLESEDIGKWTCIAMLARAGINEEWATIDVKPVQDEAKVASVISIVLGSALLVLTLIGAFFAVMHVYRRRNSLKTVKSPPPYNPEDYEIPRVVQSDPANPITDKDYRY